MVTINTKYGFYQLNNAVRIDIYKTKEKKLWEVYISIDANKHLLQKFEAEKDAVIFVKQVKSEFKSLLMSEEKYLFTDLNEICKSALQKVEEEGI